MTSLFSDLLTVFINKQFGKVKCQPFNFLFTVAAKFSCPFNDLTSKWYMYTTLGEKNAENRLNLDGKCIEKRPHGLENSTILSAGPVPCTVVTSYKMILCRGLNT